VNTASANGPLTTRPREASVRSAASRLRDSRRPRSERSCPWLRRRSRSRLAKARRRHKARRPPVRRRRNQQGVVTHRPASHSACFVRWISDVLMAWQWGPRPRSSRAHCVRQRQPAWARLSCAPSATAGRTLCEQTRSSHEVRKWWEPHNLTSTSYRPLRGLPSWSSRPVQIFCLFALIACSICTSLLVWCVRVCERVSRATCV
jgi:hypothetical protein